MLTLFDLLKINDVDPSKVRLVRHGNKEINVLETFRNDAEKFLEYMSWQRPGKFGNADYLAVFVPARGTTSLFVGLWKINGCTRNADLKPKHKAILKEYGLPENWYQKADRYDIELSGKLSELIQRLVIEWGKSTVSWVQKIDKDIVEIKAKNSIGDFVSYDNILLSYTELQILINDADANVSWVNALSTVNGVYLIRHILDGRLYVGSAYGKGGILGRWAAYAKTGHAGNKMLRELDPYNFEFSVLEISPSTMSADDVIARENRWKTCLGSREFGLNDN
jgi:hypothetical protein